MKGEIFIIIGGFLIGMYLLWAIRHIPEWTEPYQDDLTTCNIELQKCQQTITHLKDTLELCRQKMPSTQAIEDNELYHQTAENSND